MTGTHSISDSASATKCGGRGGQPDSNKSVGETVGEGCGERGVVGAVGDLKANLLPASGG
jgi:hypothetical protein